MDEDGGGETKGEAGRGCSGGMIFMGTAAWSCSMSPHFSLRKWGLPSANGGRPPQLSHATLIPSRCITPLAYSLLDSSLDLLVRVVAEHRILVDSPFDAAHDVPERAVAVVLARGLLPGRVVPWISPAPNLSLIRAARLAAACILHRPVVSRTPAPKQTFPDSACKADGQLLRAAKSSKPRHADLGRRSDSASRLPALKSRSPRAVSRSAIFLFVPAVRLNLQASSSDVKYSPGTHRSCAQ